MPSYATIKPDGRVYSMSSSDPGASIVVPDEFSDPWEIYYHDGAWHYLPDNPDDLSDFDPVAGVWFDPRTPEQIAEDEKRAFDDAVNAERARRIRAGTSVSVTGLAVQVALQGRDEDQRTLQGLCTAAQIRIGQGDVTTLTKYRDMDNTDHMLTPPQVVEMWSLGSAWVSGIYQKSWDIKDMDPRPADHTDDALWSV